MDEAILEALKAHLHEDGTESDNRIISLYRAAVQELAKAGIDNDGSDLFRLIAFEKVRCWYDNVPQPEALQRLVNQGKMTAETGSIF